MPRPHRPRRVRQGLEPRVFKPLGLPLTGLEVLGLTLDGLEALRLADVEGLYQEEAARRMGVSRATFARVLTTAHRIVAEALLDGKAIEIGGGAVDPRQPERWPCPVHSGARRRGRGCHCGQRAGRGRGGGRHGRGGR